MVATPRTLKTYSVTIKLPERIEWELVTIIYYWKYYLKFIGIVADGMHGFNVLANAFNKF